MKSGARASNVLYLWIAAAAAIPLWGCITGREMFFLVDALHQYFPFQSALSGILARFPSELPFWDPLIFCGSPLLADPQRTVYYPPALFYRLMPFAPAFGCFLAFHLCLAGTGTAAFLRARGLGDFPAGMGGIAYALGAGPSMLLGAPVVLSAYAWLPWIVFFADKLRGRPGNAAGMGLGLAFAWLALAGYPQYVLYGAVAAAIIVWAERGRTPRSAYIKWLLLAAATGGAAAAAQYLPFAGYLPDTNRAQKFVAAMAGTGALKPWDLLGFLSPMMMLPRGDEIVFGVPGKWTSLHFCGVLVLALAVTALASKRRRAAARVPSILAVTGAALAMGPGLPAIGPHLAALPPLGWIRHAGLWMCLAEFGLAWLAALGLAETRDRLFSSAGRQILTGWLAAALLLGSMGATASLLKGWMLKHWPPGSFEMADRMVSLLHPAGVLAWGLLFLWLARRKEIGWKLAAGVLLATTWAEVHGVRLKIQPTVRAEYALGAGETEEFILKRGSGWFRVFVTPRHQLWRIEEAEGLNNAATALRNSLRSNLTCAAGLRDAEGDNPLRPKGIESVLDRAKRARNPWEPEAREALGLLGVKFLITTRRIPGDPGAPAFKRHAAVYEMAGRPRPAWIEPAEAGKVAEAVEAGPGKWLIRAEMARPGKLVLSESYVRGWRARSAGETVKASPAHGALTGFDLPAGKHSLKAAYSPPAARTGLVFSGLALLGITGAGLALFLGRRRRAAA